MLGLIKAPDAVRRAHILLGGPDEDRPHTVSFLEARVAGVTHNAAVIAQRSIAEVVLTTFFERIALVAALVVVVRRFGQRLAIEAMLIRPAPTDNAINGGKVCLHHCLVLAIEVVHQTPLNPRRLANAIV